MFEPLKESIRYVDEMASFKPKKKILTRKIAQIS